MILNSILKIISLKQIGVYSPFMQPTLKPANHDVKRKWKMLSWIFFEKILPFTDKIKLWNGIPWTLINNFANRQSGKTCMGVSRTVYNIWCHVHINYGRNLWLINVKHSQLCKKINWLMLKLYLVASALVWCSLRYHLIFLWQICTVDC